VTRGVRTVAAPFQDEAKKMQFYKNIGVDGLPSPGERVGYEPTTNVKLRNLRKTVEEYDETEQQAIIGKNLMPLLLTL